MGKQLLLNGATKDVSVSCMSPRDHRVEFESDVKAFIDYLYANYRENKYFSVQKHLLDVIDKHYEEQYLADLNKRPPMPELLAVIASHASCFASKPGVYLEYDGEWKLMVRSPDGAFDMQISMYGDGYTVDGLDTDDSAVHYDADYAISTLNAYFGTRDLGQVNKIPNMFYAGAHVHLSDGICTTYIDAIISVPFATRAEAESYGHTILLLGRYSDEMKQRIRPFFHNGDFAYADDFKVINPTKSE